MADNRGYTLEQRRIIQRIARIGRQVGATPKEIKAALETGRVEANFSNPSGGDADSAGWRQERASLYRNPTNLDASIRRFFQETRAVRDKYGSSGALAAAVQRPAAQYRGRYAQVSGEAQSLLRQAFNGNIPASAGGSGGGRTTRTRTITETTPGVDNRVARAALIQQFLSDRSSDPVQFAVQANALRDIAPTSPTRTTRSSSGSADAPSRNTGPGGGNFSAKHSPLLELIHKSGNGAGYAVKNGHRVDGRQFYASVWDGHANHVHVAAGPKTIVQLGNLAKQMGLSVGENPHFGTVHQVHAPNSYHYKGEAIDVSGDPAKMNAYAARVERLYGLKS